MLTLITNMVQVDGLYKGDIVTQYYAGKEELHPVFTKLNSATYRILAIKPSNQMMELVRVEDPLIILLSPGKLGRMFLRSCNLVDDGNWWLH